MKKLWMIQEALSPVATFAEQWRVPRLVGQILLNRGLSTSDSIVNFLSPSLKDLHEPALLAGAQEAAKIIADAIQSRARIVIYGDYDVDGITGIAVLWHVIQEAGGEVSFYVPHRVDEGYGINNEAIQRIVDEGAKLVISVDCGIGSVQAAEVLRSHNVRFVITDHHAIQGPLPRADAIVHPSRVPGYPDPELCGAGVAFKVAWSLAQALSGAAKVAPQFRSLLIDLLPFVALGTIADAVPLTGENRILARKGLEGLAKTPWHGLRALMRAAGLDASKVSGLDVGFKLAPRINAAGRMGHARLAVELLTRANEGRSHEIAQYLEEHNRQRQVMERKIAHEAYDRVEQHGLAGDARRAIVMAAQGWHAGVIGIVAARVVDRYCRPTVLIALDGEKGQGSARSIHSFDLAGALAACGEHLESFGGHAMAAGLRIATERVEPFTEAFVHAANQRLTGADLIPRLCLDAEAALEELTLPTVDMINGLGPFGSANPRPRLASDWVDLADEPRRVGRNGEHLQVTFRQNGVWIKGIGFGQAAHMEDLKQHRRCRVAFEPIVNEYQGRRNVELQILDFQFPVANRNGSS